MSHPYENDSAYQRILARNPKEIYAIEFDSDSIIEQFTKRVAKSLGLDRWFKPKSKRAPKSRSGVQLKTYVDPNKLLKKTPLFSTTKPTLEDPHIRTRRLK